MTVSYNSYLVVLSVLMAIFASYTALGFGARVANAEPSKVKYWLLGGAASMGIGIWSMHFIGMLAFHLPIPLGYDVSITLLSVLPAFIASGIALYVLRSYISRPITIYGAAVLMGIGITTMHYTGMTAMRMSPPIRYDPGLFTLSVLIAIVASWAALKLAMQVRDDIQQDVRRKKMGSSIVMGFAITGMHYTGMAAASFDPQSLCLAATGGFEIPTLAMLTGIGGFVVLSISLIAIIYDNLKGQNTFYQTLLDAQLEVGEGVIVIEGQRIVYANETACTLFGYNYLKETQQLSSLFEGAYTEEWQQVQTVLESGSGAWRKNHRFEINVKTATGKIKFIGVTVKAFLYREKIRFLFTCFDISERKQTEDALQQSEKMLNNIMETLPIMVFLKDAKDLRFKLFNKAGTELVGIPQDQLLGHNDYDFFPKEEADFFTSKDREVLASHTVLDIPEEPIQTRDKGVRILHTRKVGIYDDQDNPQYLLGISEDVTEHKQVEKALRESEERSIIQRQLQQGQKMEALGQLTGGIAHDFNNILTSILGFTDLTLEGLAPDQGSKPYQYLQQIQISGERAHDLVTKLLTFSRGIKTEAKPMQIQPLIKEIAKTLQSVLPSSMELVYRIGENVPAILMEEVSLHQMLMKLCINARDALGGKGHLEISLRRTGKLRVICDSCHKNIEGDFVELSVSDNGQGIPEDVLPRIFEPFFSTKEVSKGTGMGLSVVHGIAHEHGGHIRVKSEPGEGSTFRLLFPPVMQEITKPVGASKMTRRLVADGKRILIVDDEPAITHFYTELFEGQGFAVKSYNDPVEALIYFQTDSGAVDLVLTDQTMPGMTGAEMAQEMLKQRPNLPVILATGYSDLIDEQDAKKMNIRAFLNKPVVTDRLLALIGELLQVKA